MEYVRLGSRGPTVSRLGLGGLFVSSFGAEFDEATSAVRRAVELGVNYVDTAPTYADSEEVLGRILPGIDAPLVVSTKLGGRPDPFDPKDRDALLRSVDESLRLLGRDRVDLLMVHEPDRPGQYDWWTDWESIAGPVLDVLEDLRARGVVGSVGCGGTTPYVLAHVIESGRFDVVLTAFNYSLLWREAAEAVIPVAVSRGMGVIAGSPLQQGALARRYESAVSESTFWLAPARRKQFARLYDFVDRNGIALPELAIRFVVSNPAVDCVLMGARSVAEVEANVAAVERGPLADDVLAELDDIAAMVPYRPTEEPLALGGRLASPGAYAGPGELV